MARSDRPVNYDIQGLRAVCVVAVVVFHLNNDWLPGGFLGVDFFFVLSGFLMAQVLIKQFEKSGKILFAEFYARRFKRLLPAMMVVALISFPIAYFSLLPSDMRDYSASLVGVVTLTLNKMVANNIGYFSPLADTQPLLHYWSLMVELQFYLIIPVIFLCLHINRFLLIVALISLALVSLVLAQDLSFENPKNNYFLLPSRLWELLLGCLLFFASRKMYFQREFARAASYMLLLLTVLGFAFFDSSLPHPSFWTVLPVLGFSALLLLSNSSSNRGNWLLSFPAMVFVGNISFSLYLWHYVLIVAFRQTWGEINIFSSLLIVVWSVALAFITYELVETPFWRGQIASGKKIKQASIFFMIPVIIISIGVWGYFSNGLEDRWLKRVEYSTARAYELVKSAQIFNEFDQGDNCRARQNQVTEDLIVRIENCSKQRGKGVLVIGDSHAIGLWRLINYQAQYKNSSQQMVIGLSRGGCKPYEERQGCSFKWLIDNRHWLAEHFSQLIYVQAGATLLSGNVVSKVQAVDVYLEVLAEVVPVIWLGPRTESALSSRDFIREGCESGISSTLNEKNLNLKKLNDRIPEIAKAENYRILPGNLVDIDQTSSCEALYWRDSNHWSPDGIRYLSGKLPVNWWLD